MKPRARNKAIKKFRRLIWEFHAFALLGLYSPRKIKAFPVTLKPGELELLIEANKTRLEVTELVDQGILEVVEVSC